MQSLTVCHEGNNKGWYKSKNNHKELKKSRSTTNVSLVLLMNRMGMHFVHHHVGKHLSQPTKTFINKNSR